MSDALSGKRQFSAPFRSGERRKAFSTIFSLFLVILLAFPISLSAQDKKEEEDLSNKVSIESIILDAAPSDPSGKQAEPTLDALAKNVKDTLAKLKNYGKFDTRFYDLDNVDKGAKAALSLKKKIQGMTVTVTPQKPEGDKFRYAVEWKQDEKLIIKNTNIQLEGDRWFITNCVRDNGNSYLLLVRVSDPIKDLKAERKKRGLPEVKKKEEDGS